MYQKIKAKNLITMMDAVESAQATKPEFVMEFKDDRWIVMAKDESNVILASVLVPHTAMAEYNRNNYDYLGMDTERLRGFIQSKTDWIEMELDQMTLHLNDGDANATLATIDPESVSGRIGKTPKIDHEVKIKGGMDKIMNFINRVEGVLPNTGAYYIGTREDGVFLYATGDNGRLIERIEWDEFDGHEIDWSVNNKPPGEGHVPKDDHATDCIMSIDHTKSVNQLDGEVKVGIGNHIPLRLLYQHVGHGDDDNSMMVNYYITPRIDEGDGAVIPKKAIEEER